jgi:TolB-like protein/Tfp pilus assembly protein PilF
MSPESTGFRALLAELRRRRVFRVAAVYAAVGFVLVEVANNFFPALHLPAWTTTLVAVLVVLGFPIALVLAWALDLTPDGIRRAEPARPRASAGTSGRWTAQRIAAVGGALVLAMAGGAFLLTGGRSDGTVAVDREVERSVAVLPFANLSAEADNEYFSDGITEDIRGRLSRIGELRVISRTSAMTYKGTTQRAGAIGRELGVAHLIEGSVQRSGDRLRVSAQLVDARTDETRWSETYDRHVTDVFAIQSEIAERIADALRVRLTAGDRALLGRAQTTNLAAYELYLKADELMRRRSPGMAERRADVLSAVALLRQAVQLDPDYALPYAFLAWGYDEHPDLTLGERKDSARSFAERVVRMAPELPDGYAELGYFYLSLGELERSGEQLRLALARDPNHEVALAGMRDYLRASGRLAESLTYAKRAVEVVPTDPESYAQVGRTYAMLGAFDTAETWYRRAWFEVSREPAAGYCELADIAYHRGDARGARGHLDALLASADPGEFALNCAAYLELALGNVKAAREVASRGAQSSFFESGDEMPRLLLAVLALDEGDRPRAEALLRAAESRTREEWDLCAGRCGNYQLARIRALQGDPDGAIGYLRRAVDTGLNRWYPSAPDPFLSGIHGDPRYQAIVTDVRARRDRERERAVRAGG